MATKCIYIAYNGTWSANNKYLDHETKLILVTDSVTFHALQRDIFNALNCSPDDTEAKIWFDTNLDTSKGMIVTNDQEFNTCLHLLSNDQHFSKSRFIVELSRRNDTSSKSSSISNTCPTPVNEAEDSSAIQQHQGNLIELIDQHEELMSLTDQEAEDAQQWKNAMAEDVHTCEEVTLPEPQTTNIEDQPTPLQFYTPMATEEDIGQPSKVKKVRRGKKIEIESAILGSNATLLEVNAKSVFQDKESVKKCTSNIAITKNIQFKVSKSSKTRYWLRCLDSNCTWRFHASRISRSMFFKVDTFQKVHTCSIDFVRSDQRNATSKLICDYIVELVRDTVNVITPKFVVEEMRRRYGITISYHKGWRAIQHAYSIIRGSPEENYMMLPSYLHMMKKKNPGTYTNIKRDAENRFQYAFFAYAASIQGWINCRPIMMVDATFLKSKYQGVLMIAVSKDGNNNIFPLAFGIADSENNNAYNWFSSQLRNAFGTREQVSILSDRNASIANAIANVYPECQHGICIYNMEKNLRTRFCSDTVVKLFYNAAITYNPTAFDSYMQQIHDHDAKVAKYLKEERPERWARSHHTNKRYNMLTTNNVECMNAVLAKARKLPILGLIDYIQNKLQSWFYERRNDARATFHDLTRWAEEELTNMIPTAFRLIVNPSNDASFTVKDGKDEFTVDLKERSCGCLQFQTNEIPCIHAIAAIERRNLNKSTYCAHWFKRNTWMQTYQGEILPVGSDSSWDVPQSIKEFIVHPPNTKIQLGRRQTKRYVSRAEFFKSTIRCSRCKRIGHNRTSCLHTPVQRPYARRYRNRAGAVA